MHAHEEPSHEASLDLSQLDRLVDGELPDDERLALLERLETEPGAWRRCALAFLEAQCWGQGLRAVLTAPAASPAPVEKVRAAPSAQRRSGAWKFLEQGLMIAASFLVAFSLGIAARGWVSGGAAGPQVAGQSGATAVGPTLAASGADRNGASAPRQVVLKWAGESGGEREVPLPVLQPEDLARQWLDAGQSQPPQEWLRQLGRLGHRVERVRDLVPVRLSDGTEAEVPVEGYQIRYVGDDYQ